MSDRVTVSMLVAVAANGVIGRDGDLPWRLSSDLKRFKAMTLGKPVIMGRKCYESIGKPLPGRPNIVVSRNRDFAADGVTVVGNLQAAIAAGQRLAGEIGADEICIIGGGEIYRQGIEFADVLHVTHVLADIPGDTFFPDISPDIWSQGTMTDVPAGEKDSHATSFGSYTRRSATN